MNIENSKQSLRLIRDFPNFRNRVNRYREVWNKAERKTFSQIQKLLSKCSGKSQVFMIPYNLPGNCEYELKIDVDKLKLIAKEIDLMEDNENILNKYLRGKDYIEKWGSILGVKCENETLKENNGLKIGMFPDIVREIVKFNMEGIDKEYAKTRIDATDPILCLDMTGIKDSFPPFCIVEGNHQAYAKAYLTNKNYIETYIISRNLWIQCLLTESDKSFVKIFNNINCMLCCMAGLVTEEDANKRMYNLY